MTDAVTGINQTNYMTLFMQELTYQDPLKPVDNREFMAQMAQFSALQQAEASSEALANIASMTTSNQSLMLLGKMVTMAGSNESGEVVKIEFTQSQPPKLIIRLKDGNVMGELRDIQAVQ